MTGKIQFKSLEAIRKIEENTKRAFSVPVSLASAPNSTQIKNPVEFLAVKS